MYLAGNIIFVCLSSLAVALEDPRNAQVRSYDFQNDGTGPYKFSFETSDGTKREEEGSLVHPNTDHAAVVVRGSFSYFGPDGVEYKVKYTADENGFHPEGDHFKVPPFVPWIHHHHHDDEQPIVTGERILDAYQTPQPEKQVYPNQVQSVTPTAYSYSPPLQSTTFPPLPVKQTNSFPSSAFDNTRPSNPPFAASSTYSYPPLGAQTTYGSTLPDNTYLTTPKPLFQESPSSPSAYLPSTPSPKPVAFVPENIEKGRELARNNEEIKSVFENAQNNIYLPSSTPKSVEITLHSVNPLGTEVNHL
ncbi:pupal cuticle protein-like [Aethina tumida]|uniref:pupal cuticle protein-like n=1 Tax=Aethina tumida TaxID=116153 RepID=UPI0021484EFC|nr:pupal cuticle protein-like [Aethina tumida]